MLIKRRINTAEVNNFPMITKTCPNDNINRVNIFNYLILITIYLSKDETESNLSMLRK